MAQKVVEALVSKFADAIEGTETHYGDEVVIVKRDKLVEIAQYLKADPSLDFDSPVFVTCIDLWGTPAAAGGQRFEVCFQLRSLRHKHRVRLKVRLNGDDPKVPSLSGIWPAFNWQERETFDMYGIEFQSHPDLRRIYLYDEFVGYPLRKDYPKEKRQPLVRRDDLDG